MVRRGWPCPQLRLSIDASGGAFCCGSHSRRKSDRIGGSPAASAVALPCDGGYRGGRLVCAGVCVSGIPSIGKSLRAIIGLERMARRVSGGMAARDRALVSWQRVPSWPVTRTGRRRRVGGAIRTCATTVRVEHRSNYCDRRDSAAHDLTSDRAAAAAVFVLTPWIGLLVAISCYLRRARPDGANGDARGIVAIAFDCGRHPDARAAATSGASRAFRRRSPIAAATAAAVPLTPLPTDLPTYTGEQKFAFRLNRTSSRATWFVPSAQRARRIPAATKWFGTRIGSCRLIRVGKTHDFADLELWSARASAE